MRRIGWSANTNYKMGIYLLQNQNFQAVTSLRLHTVNKVNAITFLRAKAHFSFQIKSTEFLCQRIYFDTNLAILSLCKERSHITRNYDVYLPFEKFFMKTPAPGTESHQLSTSLVVRTPVLTRWLKIKTIRVIMSCKQRESTS